MTPQLRLTGGAATTGVRAQDVKQTFGSWGVAQSQIGQKTPNRKAFSESG